MNKDLHHLFNLMSWTCLSDVLKLPAQWNICKGWKCVATATGGRSQKVFMKKWSCGIAVHIGNWKLADWKELPTSDGQPVDFPHSHSLQWVWVPDSGIESCIWVRPKKPEPELLDFKSLKPNLWNPIFSTPALSLSGDLSGATSHGTNLSPKKSKAFSQTFLRGNLFSPNLRLF